MVLLGITIYLAGTISVKAGVLLQQPTVAVPTVTGTPEGPSIRVNADQTMIYVHSGPGQNYPIVGILVAGQKAPALAMSPDESWIKITYLGTPGNTGWIFSRFVSLSEPLQTTGVPPTPTQRVTPTLDPTIAAQYLVGLPPTQLPTFTAPPPIMIPTYPAEEQTFSTTRFPLGFLIIGLAVVGVFGVFLSLLRTR